MPKDLILRIEHLNGSRYQCTALASPNRYGKRYEKQDLTDLHGGDEKVSPIAISHQAFAGPLLSVIVGLAARATAAVEISKLSSPREASSRPGKRGALGHLLQRACMWKKPLQTVNAALETQ